MPPRCFCPLLWQYAVLLLLATAIALLGCSKNDDNVTTQDVENRTFIFDSSFIDDDLEGLTTILTFGAISDDNHVPFTLTLQDAVSVTDVAIVIDTATVGSIELPIGDIEIFDVTLPDPVVFDVHVHEEDDGTLEFTFTNDNGNELSFRFEIGATSAVASPK